MEGKVMGRPKKDGHPLNCIIRSDLFAKLEKYAEEMGQTKTIVVERALEKVFAEYEKNKNKGGK